jgi:hypothetical protein
MPARRTFAHAPHEGGGGWSAIALHLETAEAPKEGFYLTLFPDARPPSVVYLRAHQVGELLDLAALPQTTDQQLWDFVAKIPLEPLLPSRGLSARLRALLADHGAQIREQVKQQHERQPPPSPTPVEEPAASEPAPPLPNDPFHRP